MDKLSFTVDSGNISSRTQKIVVSVKKEVFVLFTSVGSKNCNYVIIIIYYKLKIRLKDRVVYSGNQKEEVKSLDSSLVWNENQQSKQIKDN